MKGSSDSVTVCVPGSTSNCGAGFDTLGLGLRIYNRVALRRNGAVGSIVPEVSGDRRGQGMVESTAQAFFKATCQTPIGFAYQITGDVPPARGLGSSVTVIGGVLAGLNFLTGASLAPDGLVEIANELEGHPDNAAAGILGGFCVARCDPTSGRYLGSVRFSVQDDLVFVVASPSVEVVTKESRGALPERLPFFEAVKSINSATFLVAVFATKNYEQLRYAVTDFMHEPYRLPRIPGGRPAIRAGIQAGAYTGWLSGSGSSVLCVARPSLAPAVGEAMKAAFSHEKIPCVVRTLCADNEGLKIE